MSSISNQRQQPDYHMLCKVVFTGDMGVGKTCLLTRQTEDIFHEKHLATIGVDFKIKTYDLGFFKVKAQLWDTAGQERFRSIQKPYYKGANAICLCFSLNNRQSFDNLPRWIQQLIEFDVPRENMFLIGCKSDLDIEVPTDEILLFAQQHKIQYHQTSARENEGIAETFNNIMIHCAQKQLSQSGVKKEEKKEEVMNLNEGVVDKIKKKTCC